MEHIVRKLEPLDIPADQPSRPTDGTRRDIILNVEAETLQRQQKRAVVRNTRGGGFEMYCDEGAQLGGDDEAPPPLAYFSAGIAF